MAHLQRWFDDQLDGLAARRDRLQNRRILLCDMRNQSFNLPPITFDVEAHLSCELRGCRVRAFPELTDSERLGEVHHPLKRSCQAILNVAGLESVRPRQ
jgi:hypothetical protein